MPRAFARVAVGLTLAGTRRRSRRSRSSSSANEFAFSYTMACQLAVGTRSGSPCSSFSLRRSIISRPGPCSVAAGRIMMFFCLRSSPVGIATRTTRAHGMAAPMVVIGDAFHKFLDGVIIGRRTNLDSARYHTALAVATHEIPKIGDMATCCTPGTAPESVHLEPAVRPSLAGAIVAVSRWSGCRTSPIRLSVAAAGFL